MKKLPIAIFLILLVTAFCLSVCSYKLTEAHIKKDVNNALAMTLKQMPCDVITVDTVDCYRDFITIEEVRDTAFIAMKTVYEGGRQETELIAEAGCNFSTIFSMSNQRASLAIVSVAIIWFIAAGVYIRRHRHVHDGGIVYGGITFYENDFYDAEGERIHFTPMQHELMAIFFLSDNHTLSKQEICDNLWPKKPYASDTLYTLIRRLKPVVEEHSQLKIESDRGRSYALIEKKIG